MTHHIWVDRLSPFVFHLTIHGHEIGVRWYGLSYVLGFFLVYFYFKGAIHNKAVTLDEDGLYELTVASALGVVLGGRIGFVVQHPHELLTNPFFFFQIWQGGMAFFGGLAGVMIAMYWTGRRRAIGFLDLTDVAVFPASLGLAVGRIANFINGELVGKPTRSDFGVIFPQVDLQPRYPSQLFECAATFLLYFCLIALHRIKWVRDRAGRLSSIFLILYGIFRIFTDFYRDDDVYWGLFSDGQWFSLLIAFIGLLILTSVSQQPKSERVQSKLSETSQ